MWVYAETGSASNQSKGEHMSTITVHVIAITSVVINGILFNMWLFK